MGAELPAATTLQLLVVLKPRDPAGLAALVRAVTTPGSPQYRQYLSPGRFAQLYGASPSSLASVRQALSAAGLQPGPVTSDGLAIAVTTTSAAAEKAFAVHLHRLQLLGGRVAFANDAAPRLSAAAAPAVSGVVGLDNIAQYHDNLAFAGGAPAGAATPFPTQKALAETASAASATGPQPCVAASAAAIAGGGYTDDQLAAAYGFDGLYARGLVGTGITVGLVELDGITSNDIAAFDNCYGVADNVDVEYLPAAVGTTFEPELDADVVAGMAPGAKIAIANTSDDVLGALTSLRTLIQDSDAVISDSWGTCESDVPAVAVEYEAELFEEAAAQGQTVLASAGDSGSEDCYAATASTALAVDDPASQPLVTGVGGTSLTSVGPPRTESVWNNGPSGVGAGGGGISAVWPMPASQTGPGVINVYSTATTCGASSGSLCREVPDVAASADPSHGYVICCTDAATGTGFFTVGGTSGAAPLWAALVALADQGCSCRLGDLNPALYAAAAGGPGAFNDITVGSNDYRGTDGGAYPATPGYDLASGLGSPDAGNLVTALTATAAPVFRADAPPDAGTTGLAYDGYTFSASGIPVPTFAVASGALPPGLRLNATTGVLSGTPTAAGSYRFAIAATNQVSTTVGAVSTVTVVSPPLPRTALALGASPPAPPCDAPIDCAPLNAIGVDAGDNVYLAMGPQVVKQSPAGDQTLVVGTPINPGSGTVTGPAVGATLEDPVALAVDGGGDVFIADTGLNQVLELHLGGVVTVVAGDGTSGDTGDGGLATLAELQSPTSIALDGHGNLYIDDPAHARIRKVTPAGIISNFAGVADASGNLGDGFPATEALIDPAAIAADVAGDVYIDSESCIRKVDTSGVISTFAGPLGCGATVGESYGDGGPNALATFAQLGPLAVDAAGDVFVGDRTSQIIREFGSNGIVEPFAGYDNGPPGTATALFALWPFSMAFDGAGNLFVQTAWLAPVSPKTYVAEILAPRGPTFTAASPPSPAYVGDSSYSYQFAATASPPATFAVASGSLPPGLSLDPATGILKGTTTTAGTATFTLEATNALGSTVTAPISIVTVAPSVRFTGGGSSATFVFEQSGSATITTSAFPATVQLTEKGTLPIGLEFVDHGDGTASFVSGTGYQTVFQSGAFPVTVTASNGVASTTESFTVYVDQSPSFSQPSAFASFYYAESGTYQIVAAGYPAPTYAISGALPFGMSFSPATGVLSYAAPIPPSEYGSFSVTVTASGWNGTATEPLLIQLLKPQITYPQAAATADGSQPFTWVSFNGAQNYQMKIGTSPLQGDVFTSPVLGPSTTSVSVPAMSSSCPQPTWWATLFVEINNNWNTYDSVPFSPQLDRGCVWSPEPGEIFSPIDPIQWTPFASAQAYYLVVGTKPGTANVVNSGVLPPTADSYAGPLLRSNATLYATLFTEVGGGWSRYQYVTITTGQFAATLSQTNLVSPVPTSTTFLWTTSSLYQRFLLTVGTSPFGTNVVLSGLLSPTAVSYAVKNLPAGKTLYATLYTEAGGVWQYSQTTFTTG